MGCRANYIARLPGSRQLGMELRQLQEITPYRTRLRHIYGAISNGPCHRGWSAAAAARKRVSLFLPFHEALFSPGYLPRASFRSSCCKSSRHAVNFCFAQSVAGPLPCATVRPTAPLLLRWPSPSPHPVQNSLQPPWPGGAMLSNHLP